MIELIINDHKRIEPLDLASGSHAVPPLRSDRASRAGGTKGQAMASGEKNSGVRISISWMKTSSLGPWGPGC